MCLTEVKEHRLNLSTIPHSGSGSARQTLVLDQTELEQHESFPGRVAAPIGIEMSRAETELGQKGKESGE
jgi:hypothetical protein